jgi:hypothetical protein
VVVVSILSNQKGIPYGFRRRSCFEAFVPRIFFVSFGGALAFAAYACGRRGVPGAYAAAAAFYLAGYYYSISAALTFS